MQTPHEALAAQHAELESILAGADEAGWARASRCPGWSVSDVVLHLAQTNELAAASARGHLQDAVARLAAGVEPASDVDAWADRVVAHERGPDAAAVHARYAASAEDMLAAFAEADPHARVLWVAGEMSSTTLVTTRLAETWAHTGDVSAALGVETEAGERLWHLCRLAWRTLPYAFSRAGRGLSGPVAFELTAPDGDGWRFTPDGETAATVVRGPALDLCLVAIRRVDAGATVLTAEGPDAAAVLGLVRTFA